MPTFPDNYEYEYSEADLDNAESALQYTNPAISFDFLNYTVYDVDPDLTSMYAIKLLIEDCFSRDQDNHLNILYELNESPDELDVDDLGEFQRTTLADIHEVHYIHDQILDRDQKTVVQNMNIFKNLTHRLNTDPRMEFKAQGVYKQLVEILYFYYSTVIYFQRYRNLPEYRMPYLNIQLKYFIRDPGYYLYDMMSEIFRPKSKNLFIQTTKKVSNITLNELLEDNKIMLNMKFYKDLIELKKEYSTVFGIDTNDQLGLIESFIKYSQGAN